MLKKYLKVGGFESINEMTDNEYDAYHPDYDSDGWKNAILLSAILYSLIGEETSENVDEKSVREAIISSCDIYGNCIENMIGNNNSFYGDGRNNYFYEL